MNSQSTTSLTEKALADRGGNSQSTTSLTEKELADRWGLSVRTLQDWRRKGTGIAYLKLGRAIRYRMDTVWAYEADNAGNVGAVI